MFIPLFSFQDFSSFGNEKPSSNLLLLREKQKLEKIGKFLIELYTGKKIQEPNFLNFTDVYVKLNTENDYVYDNPEPYFGVTQNYISKFNDFRQNKIVSTPDFIAFDNLLLDSFYEFIYKLTMLDISSKTQFESFETALKHPS